MLIGVGLLLFIMEDGELKLHVVRELEDKPAICKEKGMESFPLETKKQEDATIQDTLDRLISEEMGYPRDLVELRNVVTQEFQLIPGRDDVRTLYSYGMFWGDPYNGYRPKDTDIVFAGWKSMEELLSSFTRVEVRPIIEHFKQHHLPDMR